LRHVLTLHNAANLGLETHVKHAIGLIKDQILDVLQGDATSLYEIDQSTRSSNKQIAATLNLSELGTNIGTAVDNTRSDPRSVGELSGFIKNLGDKFAGRGKNQRGGVSLALTAELASGISGHGRRAVDEGLREDGEQETTRLSGTSLSTGHQITTTHNDGDRVLLDRSGNLVVSKLDIAAEMLIQRRSGELVDRLRNLMTRSLNGNVIVLLEVDTGVLLRGVIGGTKKLALDTGVSRARNVLSIAPLAITRAASSVTTTASRVTIQVAATTAVTTSTAPAAPAVVVVVLIGGNVVAPVGLTGTIVLVSPCTVAKTIGTRSSRRRTTVHSRRTTLGSTALAAHVRGDVGSLTLGRALLGAIVEGETTHVDLISHDDSRDSDQNRRRKIVRS